MESKKLYFQSPETPGVYIMKDARGSILYIGKAGNLRRRVSSYFLRPQEYRIQKMVSLIHSIEYCQTDSALEALILESALIKKYQPPFNVREKDDKSFLYIEITRDPYPRVLFVRGKDLIKKNGVHFGPFLQGGDLREAMRILRRIFPWNVHAPDLVGAMQKPCFDAQVGLCPGTCVGAISKKEYARTIRHLKLILQGKKAVIVRALEKEMRAASDVLEFEKANRIKRQIFGLNHIHDIALIREPDAEMGEGNVPATRIEGYDISNISGTSAVGSMVVFVRNHPARDLYRKFKIRTVLQSDDTGMLKEVLRRRLRHPEWTLPNLFLIDGGKGQVHAAESVLEEFGMKIPVVGIAKGPTRKKNEFVGAVPKSISEAVLIRVRNEAHRFAVEYHKALRSARSLG